MLIYSGPMRHARLTSSAISATSGSSNASLLSKQPLSNL